MAERSKRSRSRSGSRSPRSKSRGVIRGGRSRKKTWSPARRTKDEAKTPESPQTQMQSMGDFDVAVIAERDEGEPYGCGKCTLKFLNCCRKEPAAFLTVLCILATSASFIEYGVFPASVPHIGPDLRLNSEKMAFTRIFFEIGAFLVFIPVVYYSVHGPYRPQLIALGGMLVAIGSIVMTIAHFVNPPLDLNSAMATGLCGVKTSRVDTRTRSMYIFASGQFMVGSGSVLSTVLGVIYLDENIPYRDTPLYTSILSMCNLFGPIIGYTMVGLAGNIHGDLDKLGIKQALEVPIRPAQWNIWYGSWWLALLVGAFVSMIGACLMYPFPKQLSTAMEARIQNARDAATVQMEEAIDDQSGTHTSRIIDQIKELLCNRVFMGALLEEWLRHFMLAGILFFLTMYMRNTYDVEPSKANLMIGQGVILVALIGACFGSFLQYALRLGIAGNLRLCLVSAIAAAITSAVFAVTCPELTVLGINQHYPWDKSQPPALQMNTTPCPSATCKCDLRFDPVCYTPPPNGAWYNVTTPVTFFTKCLAMCNRTTTNEDYECGCLASGGSLRAGSCVKCSRSRLYAFVIGVAWLAAFVFLRENSIRQVQLRSVRYQLRSMATTLSVMLVRTAAAGSIYFIAAIKRRSCTRSAIVKGVHAYCAHYDNTKLALIKMGFAIGLQVLCIIAILFVMFAHRNVLYPSSSSDNGEKLPTKSKSGSDSKSKPRPMTRKRGDEFVGAIQADTSHSG